VRTLDPAFRLARIGADDVDVERVERPAELGHAVTAQRARVVDAKHPVLVAIERHRLAPGLQVSAGGMEIGESRLALDKLQMHQPARRVVDKHQQGALRSAILEPPVLAAVDLHQLADALAPVTGLMNLLAPLLAIAPQPVGDQPQPQGLAAERDLVHLAQLLGRQGRAEVPIALANDRQRLGAELLRLAPVARTTAPLRNSGQSDLRADRPSTAETLAAARAPKAGLPLSSSVAFGPNPAAPRLFSIIYIMRHSGVGARSKCHPPAN